jgi:hypothetical protein
MRLQPGTLHRLAAAVVRYTGVSWTRINTDAQRGGSIHHVSGDQRIWPRLHPVSIHPFEDGNGRTARLLADWLLQRSGLPPLGFGDQRCGNCAARRASPTIFIAGLI